MDYFTGVVPPPEVKHRLWNGQTFCFDPRCYLRGFHLFPRISSPFCFFACLGLLCFPLTRQNRYIFCWGPNSSLDLRTQVHPQLAALDYVIYGIENVSEELRPGSDGSEWLKCKGVMHQDSSLQRWCLLRFLGKTGYLESPSDP